uniref:Uncharacterized protein n=1 Tax=viral metagenome TaxID=1070528 RepID=A0A6M3J306_9ZZZZ
MKLAVPGPTHTPFFNSLINTLENRSELLHKVDEYVKPREDTPFLKTIKKNFTDLKGISDLSYFYSKDSPSWEYLLGHQMLATWRKWVIDRFKDPLRLAIIAAGKKLVKKFDISKKRMTYRNSHTKLDIKRQFLEWENNKAREDLFEAAFDIDIAEYEHDPYYHFREDVILELYIQAILDGKYDARPEGWPLPNADKPKHWNKHWLEPAPYGGKHSIIAKMIAHREEINKLLEE